MDSVLRPLVQEGLFEGSVNEEKENTEFVSSEPL